MNKPMKTKLGYTLIKTLAKSIYNLMFAIGLMGLIVIALGVLIIAGLKSGYIKTGVSTSKTGHTSDGWDVDRQSKIKAHLLKKKDLKNSAKKCVEGSCPSNIPES